MGLRIPFDWVTLCAVLSICLPGCLAGCAAGGKSTPKEYERGVERSAVLYDGAGQLMCTDKVVALREGRTTQSTTVGNLKVGQKVKTGFSKNGWSAVFCPQETELREDRALGYVPSQLLTPAAQKVWGQIKYLHVETKIRAGRGADTRVLGRLPAGQAVKVDFLEKNWYAVFDVQETVRSEENALGYVFAPLLRDGPLPH